VGMKLTKFVMCVAASAHVTDGRTDRQTELRFSKTALAQLLLLLLLLIIIIIKLLYSSMSSSTSSRLVVVYFINHNMTSD